MFGINAGSDNRNMQTSAVLSAVKRVKLVNLPICKNPLVHIKDVDVRGYFNTFSSKNVWGNSLRAGVLINLVFSSSD